MPAYPLFEAHPRLGAALPVAGLLAGPTPVEPLAGTDRVFVKRDDLTAPDYGGNKVRKLDLLLAQARARAAREVLTFGYAGSNFVAATAWHGRKLGLSTVACLLHQRPHEYAADNLSVDLAAGARLQVAGSTGAVAVRALAGSLAALLRSGRAPAWIPPGGSSPLGTVGFINAAFELKRQVEGGAMPEPDVIYAPFSSMGTVAGLAIGLELAGLRAGVQAVQVVGERFASGPGLGKLTANTWRWLRRRDDSLRPGDAPERVRIRTEFIGPGYALPTPETQPAMRRFVLAGGRRADPSYTGKALAGLYHDLDDGRLDGKVVLYWHTLAARARPEGVPRLTAAQVPPALRRYFGEAGSGW